MSQNTSSAVMAQRKEPHDSLDYFPTPPWATRALCQYVLYLIPQGPICYQSAWEPACGDGHMARPLAEYFASVHASDVHDYGYGQIEDFLWPNARDADWIITNPPFRLAQDFARTALQRANCGVALLVRTAFLEGVTRWRELFTPYPPSIVAQFSERVPMVKGRVDEDATTATAYCWIVWDKRETRTRLMWIPPCRALLERPDDYPQKPVDFSAEARALDDADLFGGAA